MIGQGTVIGVATAAALLAAGGVLAFSRPAAPAPPPIARSADGHFWAEASASSDVGRATIRFLVDTGASSVALTADDARKLGLKTEQLIYSRPVSTAQGETKAAPVMLSRLSVGGAELKEVKALVMKDGPKTSLLGMSFLGRLSRIEATPEALVLRR